MNDSFGPWCTAMGSDAGAPLSASWKRRLRLLATLSGSRPRVSRRELLALGVAGLATAIVPTLRINGANPVGNATVLAGPLGDANPPVREEEEEEVPSADTTHQVVLTLRKNNGPYGTAAYSFRFATQDFEEHRNAVDLIYNGCGLLHVNFDNRPRDRIVDLGKTEFDRLKKPPKKGWHRLCIEPVKDHVYVQEINEGKTRALVKFVITDIDEQTRDVKLKWAALTTDGKRPQFYKPEGVLGTLGQCGGRHEQL